MATAMVAPMRALLTELQSAIDDAASATADGDANGDASCGLRGAHHLALCDLTRRMHEELGVLEQAVPVLDDDNDDNPDNANAGAGDGGGNGTVPAARRAMHKALSHARIAQLEAHIEGREARCAKLREHKRI